MNRGGGGGDLLPVAPGFTPVRRGEPNPDTPGTHGPLGRPKAHPTGDTPQTKALLADLKKRYPGIRLSSFRSPETQAAILGGRKPGVWVGSKYGSSHTWGTAIDASNISPKMWERFKADMRARGLRAYDEGGHVHIDDRTDLPDGPSERHRH